jgi:polar amino acid transport system permease protein
VVEIFRTAQVRQASTFNFTPYLAVALVYLALTLPMARFTDWLIARERGRRNGGPVRAAGAGRRGITGVA